MDNRKNYNTPRDRVDDEFLTRLLAEQEPYSPASRRPMTQQTRGNGNGNNRSDCCRAGQPVGSVRQEETDRDDLSCGCAKQLYGIPANLPLAMVYAPDQEWDDLYGDCEALGHGTLFKKLDLPFYPGCSYAPCCGS